MDAEQMGSSLRKLAIRLACAHADDRDWVLQQLTAAERQQIEELLQEISLLGLAADPAIVDAVMREAEQAAPVPAQPLGPLDGAASPFWLGLALQSLSPDARRQYLDARAAGKNGLLKWHKQFADEVLPPALMQHLATQLTIQDGSHEHN
jgi:hypothetical protein